MIKHSVQCDACAGEIDPALPHAAIILRSTIYGSASGFFARPPLPEEEPRRPSGIRRCGPSDILTSINGPRELHFCNAACLKTWFTNAVYLPTDLELTRRIEGRDVAPGGGESKWWRIFRSKSDTSEETP